MSQHGFQLQVQIQPAPGKPGDFAGSQIRASARGAGGGWTAAPSFPTPSGPQLAVKVGQFAWGVVSNGDPKISEVMASYFQPGAVLGFVHSEQQGLLVNFLQDFSVGVQDGYPADMHTRGEFFANFPSGAVRGQKVYADGVTGAATSAATGGSVKGSFTGSIAGNVLTCTVAPTGSALAINQTITGTGVPAGTYVVSLGTGSGGLGTYNLNQAPSANIGAEAMVNTGVTETAFSVSETWPGNPIASFTATITPDVWDADNGQGTAHPVNMVTAVLNVSAVASGALSVGAVLNFAGIASPYVCRILSQLTGAAGSTGTYKVTYPSTVASTAMTASAGTLAKITTWQPA